MTLNRLLKILLLFSLCLFPLWGAKKQSQVGIAIINDGLFFTDEMYTSGDSIYYIFEHIPLELNLQMDIYTPRRQDRLLPAPPPGVHPYGGFFYGQTRYKQAIDHWIVAYTLQLGATGKASLASDAHSRWHTIIGRPAFYGWDSQIESRFGVLADVEARYLLDFDYVVIAPIAALTLSNLRPAETLGIGLVSGYHFDKPDIYLKQKSGYSFTFTGEVRLSHIEFDVFLTGFENDYPYAVTPRPFITEIVLGFDSRWGNFGINFVNHNRSSNYTTKEDWHNYAKLDFYLRF